MHGWSGSLINVPHGAYLDHCYAWNLQTHFLRVFVANLKNDAIYGFYPESFCDKNLAIWKVFAFSDSAQNWRKDWCWWSWWSAIITGWWSWRSALTSHQGLSQSLTWSLTLYALGSVLQTKMFSVSPVVCHELVHGVSARKHILLPGIRRVLRNRSSHWFDRYRIRNPAKPIMLFDSIQPDKLQPSPPRLPPQGTGRPSTHRGFP